MKSFFRIINCALLAVALLAAAFCGYLAYSLAHFSGEEYDAEIARLKKQAEKIQADTAAARSETEERLAFLRADLRNNGEEASALADRLEELRAAESKQKKRLRKLKPEAALYDDLPGAVEQARKEYALKIRELEDKILNGESDVRICYWTLDDGPTQITHQFLDAFDELGEHVYATFFTAYEANSSFDEEEMLRREMTEGHSVQNHTYSHNYGEEGKVYISLESFKEQVLLQDDYLYKVTGFHPGIFRFPGGGGWGGDLLPDAKPLLAEMGYQWADWNCNLYDAGANLQDASMEISTAMSQIPAEKIAVVLGHDWNMATLITIKNTVPKLQELGFVFLPLFPESAMMSIPVTR